MAVLTGDDDVLGSVQFMSPERFLALLLVGLGIAPAAPDDLRTWTSEEFGRVSVRRLTDALLLVQEQLNEHWRQDGDTSLADALTRARADQFARQDAESLARWLAQRDRSAGDRARSGDDGPASAGPA